MAMKKLKKQYPKETEETIKSSREQELQNWSQRIRDQLLAGEIRINVSRNCAYLYGKRDPNDNDKGGLFGMGFIDTDLGIVIPLNKDSQESLNRIYHKTEYDQKNGGSTPTKEPKKLNSFEHVLDAPNQGKKEKKNPDVIQMNELGGNNNNRNMDGSDPTASNSDGDVDI